MLIIAISIMEKFSNTYHSLIKACCRTMELIYSHYKKMTCENV